MRQIVLLAITLFIIQGCGSNSNDFTIEGKYDNAEEKEISLIELKTEGTNKIDSMKIDDDGSFSLSGYTEIPSFFVVEAGEGNSLTLIVKPGERIRLSGDLNDLNSTYKIKGSEDSEKIVELRKRLENTIAELDSLGNIFRENPDDESTQDLRDRLNKESREIVNEHKEYTKEFIDDNMNSLASLMALYQQIGPQSYVLDPKEDFEYFEKVDSSLMESYPNSDPVQSLHSQVTDMKNRQDDQQTASGNISIGEKAPDIALPTPEGDTVSLHSLRGEYVLLDFWAAWCKPCRVENPKLVEAYKKYKDKGFEIYQVSLDRERKDWEDAIEKDKLEWINVSDLKFWNSSAAQKYNIQSIPANYLLNEEGEIIEKDLRGDALDQKLNEIFN
ncbi:MAG: TlpA disulfide reductase family protein [Bacteroidales bacterium]